MILLGSLASCKPRTEPPKPRTESPHTDSTGAECGELRCITFATSGDALAFVLASKPRVVAFGESHALHGAQDVLTATERFGAAVLPLLRNHGASTLIVELVDPPRGCPEEKAAVAAVQKPVVQSQDSGNQARFVHLGHRARELNMVPLLLEPSCDDFRAVRQAGADGVAALLDLITVQTRQKVERLLPRLPDHELLVAYGGALHNDIAAPGESKPFAFGADLWRLTSQRYVAFDLIVPEFVGSNETWRSLPWYPYWPNFARTGVTLIETKPGDYTLILERNQRRAAPDMTTGQ